MIKELELKYADVDPEDTMEAKLFAEWQAALYQLLLPHQQKVYNDAIGEPAGFLKNLFLISFLLNLDFFYSIQSI